MRVAVSGSTGLVGSQVVASLSAAGHEVVRLVRRPPAPGEKAVRWDPEKGEIDAAGLEGLDAVVHLAGENIASGRWNAARKAAIRDSRVNGTRLLCDALAGLARPPKTLVCASAIGYYGDRGEERVDRGESARHGISRRGLPGVGGGLRAGRAEGDPRRGVADRGRALAEGGGALADAPARSGRGSGA